MYFCQIGRTKTGSSATTGRKTARLAVLSLSFVLIALPLASHQTKAGGVQTVVVSVTGDWVYDNQGTERPVYFGKTFESAACVFGNEGSVVLKKNWIDRKQDGPLVPFPCEEPSRDASCSGHTASRCAVNVDPTKEWKSGGFLQALGDFWAAVLPAVRESPQRYMVAVSRGAEDELVDAVVPLQNGQMDLSPAFRQMSAGNYWVKVWPVDAGSNTGVARELRFRPKTTALIDAVATKPGLYRLSIVDHETGQPIGSEAWILASGANDYAANAAEFQSASERTSKLPQEMDPASVRSLLRAYLESLDRGKREGKS